MQKVMGQVVADITKNAPTEHRGSDIPVPVEDCMGQLVEGCCKNDEKGWRHHKA